MLELWEFSRTVFTKGGPVMWPLLACSILSLTITIERIIFWWRISRLDDSTLIEEASDLTSDGLCDEAAAKIHACRTPGERILHAGLAHRRHGLTEAMQVQADTEIARMKQGLGVLDTIITMAPMLGILGTVTGIIRSFDLLGKSGIKDPEAVTGGIAEALITTAAGLVIALATLIPFNWLMAKTQRAAKRLEQIATHFEVAYRKGMDRK